MTKPLRFMTTPAEDGRELLDVLAGRLRVSKRAAKRLLDEHRVFVGDRRVWMARHRLRAGERFEVQGGTDSAPSAPERLTWLFKDDHFAIVDKPPGLVSNEDRDSVEARLRRETGCATWQAAHRLDRDTSGCLLFARTPEDFEAAVALFRSQQVTKIYRAVVVGAFPRTTRVLHAPIDGRPAETHVEVVSANASASHLRLQIATGRTHQIRRHLLGVGFAVAGDKTYGASRRLDPVFRSVPRQMLHAAEMEFPHPAVADTVVRARAALPDDFVATLRRLGLR